MRRLLPRLLVLLPVLLAPAFGAPQDVTVQARLSHPLVKLGEDLHLTIHVDGTLDAQVQPPDPVDGLIFGPLAGPQVSRVQEFHGGRTVSRVSIAWSMSIKPSRVGEFEIPPVHLVVEGQAVQAPKQSMPLRVIADVEGAAHVFIEVVDPPRQVYEGQPFDVVLQFGTDLVDGGVALFLPWWPTHRGVLEIDRGVPRGPYRFRINERYEAHVEELDPVERQGVPFRVFQLARRYVATRPGTLEFDTATFQFSETLRRSTVFSSGRYKRYHAQAPPFAIEVLPVPEEGRPLEWTGAVGELTAYRRVDRRDVDEGGTLSLTVSWSGRANTEFFGAPDLKRLQGFEDFRVLGVEDSFFSDERRVTYDLVPTTSEITQIPPVPLWVFSPTTKTFELVKTDSVAVRVRPVGDRPGEVSIDVDELDLRDVHTTPDPSVGPAPLGARNLAWSGAAIGALWLLVRTQVRRRRGDPDAPLARRRRAALRNLRADLRRASNARAQSEAVVAFLAARTGELPGAWVGRDVNEWAASGDAGLDESALSELVQLEADLDASAWSGEDAPLDKERVLRVAGSLLKGGL